MIQVSQGGAAFFAGKGVPNDKQQASIAGAVAAAHYVRSVAPIYGVPVVMHSDHCAKKLLPWLDGMLEADEAYFKEKGEPLFSCVGFPPPRRTQGLRLQIHETLDTDERQHPTGRT